MKSLSLEPILKRNVHHPFNENGPHEPTKVLLFPFDIVGIWSVVSFTASQVENLLSLLLEIYQSLALLELQDLLLESLLGWLYDDVRFEQCGFALLSLNSGGLWLDGLYLLVAQELIWGWLLLLRLPYLLQGSTPLLRVLLRIFLFGFNLHLGHLGLVDLHLPIDADH